MFTDPWALDGGLNALGSLGIHVDGRRHRRRRVAGPAGVCRGHLERHEDRRGQRPPLLASTSSRARSRRRRTPTAPLELIVDNASYFKVATSTITAACDTRTSSESPAQTMC